MHPNHFSMKHFKQKVLSLLLVLLFVTNSSINIMASSILSAETEAKKTTTHETANATNASSALQPAARSAIIMEAKTGTVIFDQNADERLRPASVTKIMTLLLIFEGLEKKQYTLDDIVTVSEHAAGMGGSQV